MISPEEIKKINDEVIAKLNAAPPEAFKSPGVTSYLQSRMVLLDARHEVVKQLLPVTS